MHKSIETGQKKASAQSAQSAGQTNQCIEATGAAQSEQHGGATRPSTMRPRDGFRERRPDAASVVLAAGTAQSREEQEAPQQQAPPDMRTSQSAKACLRREVPTDHEARGQAQRRQLRRVATGLRRDRDPEAEAKHAKHGRIRTQISYLSRLTSDRGDEETVTSTHSGWRGRRWRWSVQQTTQHNEMPEQPGSGEACGREHVGQHVDRQKACRKQGLA